MQAQMLLETEWIVPRLMESVLVSFRQTDTRGKYSISLPCSWFNHDLQEFAKIRLC